MAPWRKIQNLNGIFAWTRDLTESHAWRINISKQIRFIPQLDVDVAVANVKQFTFILSLGVALPRSTLIPPVPWSFFCSLKFCFPPWRVFFYGKILIIISLSNSFLVFEEVSIFKEAAPSLLDIATLQLFLIRLKKNCYKWFYFLLQN